MKRLLYIIGSIFLLIACGEEEEPAYVGKPVVAIDVSGFTADGVILSVRKLNTDEVYAVALKTSEPAPSAETIIETGTKESDGRIFLGGLIPDEEYTAYAVGVKGGRPGAVTSVGFKSPVLYPWEVERDEVLFFADLDLLPGGDKTRNPADWTEERFLPHVTFKDSDGSEKWLHEAFLLIDGQVNGRLMCIDNSLPSARQSDWKDYMNFWFKPSGAVQILDMTIENAIGRIGKPSFRKHKVVMTMPDPIMLENFADKNSSTTYWGTLYDRQLDFQNVGDQILAYQWFIDQVREAWKELAPNNLELAGFYVLSEILEGPGGHNYQYKRWHDILPSVTEYLHGMNYGAYWIPYYKADGYNNTKKFGFDYVWIQPNKYWDYPEKKQKKYWSWVFETMASYGHGMEIEFEGSHGEPGWSQYEEGVKRTSSSILETVRTANDAQGTAKGSPNPQAARNKQLLRDYMNEFKEAGYYGKERIATYSGTNAMYELATSPDAADRQMYLEYCKFIVENPLRK